MKNEEKEKLNSPFLKPADAIALLEAFLTIRITPSKLSSPTTIPYVYTKKKNSK